MSATNYTLIDVVRIVGFRVGNLKRRITTLDNADIDQLNLIEAVNDTLRAMARFKGLPMLNKETRISTVAEEKTGTVACTLGSTTVTGTNTVFAATHIGRAFSTSSKNPIYRVAGVTSATSLTLDTAWVDDDISGESYLIAQDRYELPSDFSDFISVSLTGTATRDLNIKPPSEVDEQRTNTRMKPLDTGAPTMVTVFPLSSGNKRMLELDPFPEREYQLYIRYEGMAIRVQRDNDVLPVFDKNIDILYDGAEARWRSIHADNPQDRGMWEVWKNQQLPELALLDKEKTDEKTRIVPSDTSRNPRVPITGANIMR